MKEQKYLLEAKFIFIELLVIQVLEPTRTIRALLRKLLQVLASGKMIGE
jgi:hypothetical protein